MYETGLQALYIGWGGILGKRYSMYKHDGLREGSIFRKLGVI